MAQGASPEKQEDWRRGDSLQAAGVLMGGGEGQHAAEPWAAVGWGGGG